MTARPASSVAPGDGSAPTLTREDIRHRLLEYYNAATRDYGAWSPQFNMHFGYWRRGLNPLRREAMLHEMNLQVLARLALPAQGPARLADLGGGTGATARVAAAAHPGLQVDAVTLVEEQVRIGTALNAAAGLADQVRMVRADYLATGLPAASYDAVCLVESACHSEGATKSALLREAHRLLKPGGALVMVDAMLRGPVPRAGWGRRALAGIYDRWRASWAVPELCRIDLLPAALRSHGFEAPAIEDWSWRVAPSVAHVPLFAAWFAVAEWAKARGRLQAWRRRHIVASLLTPVLGLQKRTFLYAAVVARKSRP